MLSHESIKTTCFYGDVHGTINSGCVPISMISSLIILFTHFVLSFKHANHMYFSSIYKWKHVHHENSDRTIFHWIAFILKIIHAQKQIMTELAFYNAILSTLCDAWCRRLVHLLKLIVIFVSKTRPHFVIVATESAYTHYQVFISLSRPFQIHATCLNLELRSTRQPNLIAGIISLSTV